MRVAPNNIFPGARIRLGDNYFTVIKVNAKSFYCAEMSYSDYLDKWNNRAKGVTFTALCKYYDIKSHKYAESFEIEENEFNRKDLAEANNSQSYKLKEWELKDLLDTISLFKKKKREIRLYQFESRKSLIRILEVKNNSYLLNVNNDYILISLDTGECIKISTVYDFKNKYDHIPWELLSEYAVSQAIA